MRSSQVQLPRQDWGEAIESPTFYGRTTELEQLCTWIWEEYSRLVIILGIGGVGKTTLSIKLGQQIQEQFEVVIWRSLREAPPLNILLPEVLRAIGDGLVSDSSGTCDGSSVTNMGRRMLQSSGSIVSGSRVDETIKIWVWRWENV